MKPFDLEAAKRGDPIVSVEGKIRLFVGVDSAGYVVVEDLMGKLIRCSVNSIFMAPKKRTVWVNFVREKGYISSFCHASEAEANNNLVCYKRIGGKAYPVELEE